MAYSAKDAMNTFLSYIGVKEEELEFIEETNNRGMLLTLPNKEKCVVFLYPISHKADDSKNFFDTRDSGAKERGKAWNYAIQNKLKYFCFAVHDEVDRYKDYIFSLECDEKIISSVSGTINGKRSGSGTQVVIPNSYAPNKTMERIITKNGFYLSAINKNSIFEYMQIFDNRPYMDSENSEVENDFSDEIVLIDKPHQRIFFGAPGTGKSYALNEEAREHFGENYERVTFHPDYSYANFVGTYKPAMEEEHLIELDEEGKGIIEVLRDEHKTAQEKYDELFEIFKNQGSLTRLPLLLGLYTDGNFKTKKLDGTYAVGDNNAERNSGVAIRKFVSLINGAKGKSNIVYKYVPGPFMRVYVNALRSAMSGNPKPYLLIIEEINRANVAAVFGDVFQLLDRSKEGESEYPIQASEDMKKYLAQELGGEPSDYSILRIPSNMYIWATMNSADQGVMPIDTAFRRRWEFKYLGIDEAADKNQEEFKKYRFKINSTETVNWDEFRRELNKRLSTLNIPEDKLIGPYFVSKVILEGTDLDKLTETIKNKVLMYLYEDAAKAFRSSLFAEGKFGTYSSVCKNFDENALSLFKQKLEIESEMLADYDSMNKNESFISEDDLSMVADNTHEFGS